MEAKQEAIENIDKRIDHNEFILRMKNELLENVRPTEAEFMKIDEQENDFQQQKEIIVKFYKKCRVLSKLRDELDSENEHSDSFRSDTSEEESDLETDFLQQIKINTEFEKRLNKFKGIKDKPLSIAQSIKMGLKQKVQAPIMNSKLAKSINLAFASK